MPYDFKVRELVKFKDMETYAKHKLSAWSWLCVIEKQGTDVYLQHRNPPNQDCNCCAPFWEESSKLDPPLGFSEIYTLQVKDLEQAKQVREWLYKRNGITVFVSHALSTPGRYMFTPGDRTDKPHWSMELIEIVKDISRLSFMVVDEVYQKPKEGGWKYDKHGKCWFKETEINFTDI